MRSKRTRQGNIKQYRSDGQNGICGVYPYLTRLQVAKFALAGGNYCRRNKIISYQVVRIEQFNKGSLGKIGGETERTSKHHRNEDIDGERTPLNLYFKRSEGGFGAVLYLGCGGVLRFGRLCVSEKVCRPCLRYAGRKQGLYYRAVACVQKN